MDIKQLLLMYSIENSEQGKNVSKSWIGVNCPFCNDSGFHGGFNLKNPRRYHCWRCGGHKAEEAFIKLSSLPRDKARELFSKLEIEETESEDLIETGSVAFSLPMGCGSMNKRHKEYLKERGFDPDYLENKYKLLGTYPFGFYGNRIVAPIFHKGKMVSYQARTILNNPVRYKACKMEQEIIHYKHILYNLDNCNKDHIVVFEGMPSVWRWGDNTVATFGISWTPQQAKLLMAYKRVFIFFDSDLNARKQSRALAATLSSFNIDVRELDVKSGKDPAEFSGKEVKYFKNFLKIG